MVLEVRAAAPQQAIPMLGMQIPATPTIIQCKVKLYQEMERQQQQLRQLILSQQNQRAALVTAAVLGEVLEVAVAGEDAQQSRGGN